MSPFAVSVVLFSEVGYLIPVTFTISDFDVYGSRTARVGSVYQLTSSSVISSSSAVMADIVNPPGAGFLWLSVILPSVPMPKYILEAGRMVSFRMSTRGFSSSIEKFVVYLRLKTYV